MNVLLIGAHPDDETFASGTLAKYAAKGYKVTIVHATKGGKGHWSLSSEELRAIRVKEMSEATLTLGADVRLLDY